MSQLLRQCWVAAHLGFLSIFILEPTTMREEPFEKLSLVLISSIYHKIISSSSPVTVFTQALPFLSAIKEKYSSAWHNMEVAQKRVALEDAKMNKVVSVSMTAVFIWLWNQLPHLLCYQFDMMKKEGFGEDTGFLKEGLNKDCHSFPLGPDFSFSLFSQTKHHSSYCVSSLQMKMCLSVGSESSRGRRE